MSVTGVIQLVALFYMCYRLASNVVVSYTWSEANNPSFVSVTGVVSVAVTGVVSVVHLSL
jgi:hypothetical protein